MSEPNLFEEMLAAYPMEKRELARAVYHRFADGDSTQFFSQLFLVLDVYAHYAECIPARMISANANSVATVEKLREEIALLARTLETRNAHITEQAGKTDDYCRITLAKCHETMAKIEQTVKNLGAQVDTKAIVQGINSTLESGIQREIIGPFIQHSGELAREVLPTLQAIRESADEARCGWSKRIWETAWTTCLSWTIPTVTIVIGLIALAWARRYDHQMAAQVAAMSRVMKYNQAAFQKLALAQVPIQIIPAQEDGFDHSPEFVLVVGSAHAADMQPINGENSGCIFFRSQIPEKQIRHLQQDLENQEPVTNSMAK